MKCKGSLGRTTVERKKLECKVCQKIASTSVEAAFFREANLIHKRWVMRNSSLRVAPKKKKKLMNYKPTKVEVETEMKRKKRLKRKFTVFIVDRSLWT